MPCWTPHSPQYPRIHQSGSSQNPILLGFYGGFITAAWLINSLAIWDWTQSQVPLPSQEVRSGWDWKFQSSNHMVCSSGNKPLSLGAFQNASHQHNKRDFYGSLCLGNSKGFRSSVPETGTKPSYIFLTLDHNIARGQKRVLVGTKKTASTKYLSRQALCWARYINCVV